MNAFHAMICLILLSSISSISFAKLITWTDNIPSGIKPFDNNTQQVAAIAQDNILIYSHPAVKTAL
ncbi:MAG: SRPBCC family protein, partial [Acinetobacter sp.]